MLRKIETRELLTKRQAQLKYRSNIIIMELTERVDGLDNDLGYVLYVADKERDKRLIPDDLLNDEKVIAFTQGVAYDPYPGTGKIIYHGED